MSAPDYDPRYVQGLWLYQQHRYWDSHEAWEDLWREADGAERHFYQALIQLDAALIHTEREHWGGVANLLARSLGHLEQCPPFLLGMDVTDLRGQLAAYRAGIVALRDGAASVFDEQLRPKLRAEGIAAGALPAREDLHAAHSLG